MSKNAEFEELNRDVCSLVRSAYFGMNMTTGSRETMLLKDIEQRINGYIHQDATRETVKNKRFFTVKKSSKVADLMSKKH